MDPSTNIDPELANAIPWIQDATDQAATMLASGINAEVVIIAVVMVPIFMRLLSLAGQYIETHNKDMRETIRITALEGRLRLRREFPEEYQAELADADRLALEDAREG